MAKKQESGVVMAVGLGALAALSAGAQFLYGTIDGAKKRVKIKGWMLKAKGEVLEKMEALKHVDEETYNTLLATVMKKYQGLKNIDQAEVETLLTDLKKHWKNIKKHIDEASKPKKVVAKKKQFVKKTAERSFCLCLIVSLVVWWVGGKYGLQIEALVGY